MNELKYPFNSKYILKYRRAIKRTLLENNTQRIKIRIAVLGGSTTSDVVSSLELFLLDSGFEPIFYQSEYNRFWEDAVFGNDELTKFQPDLFYIHTTHRNINFPDKLLTGDEINSAVDAEFSRFKQMWVSLAEKFACPIIQNNFELPLFRHFGNADCSNVNGKAYFISRMNLLTADFSQHNNGFYINDINYLSSCIGLEKWYDCDAWYMYKYAMRLDVIPELSYSIASIIKSIYGKTKKVLALDFDNTLWGGVIGDIGQAGIELGQETPVAQSFSDFQEFLKGYTKLGILLTGVSKNDEENAIEGLRHPNSLLHPEDFAGIKANWERKDINIAALADELNLLTESFVFVDDNPAECHIVSSQLPNTEVIKFESVSEAMYTLSRSGYFEVTHLSDDDLKRNSMYRANRERTEQAAAFSDYSDYLRSLKMQAIIADFEPIELNRITQLTNKSNQFNLTTRRYTAEQIEEVFLDKSYVRLCGKLRDRFGDNGIVSVLIGKISDDTLNIELWLMSCRVLKRNMEFAMLDTLVERCKSSGISTVIGNYCRTPKNGMVADLYEKFGFTKLSDNFNGDTAWKLNISEYNLLNDTIHVNEKEITYNE